MYSTYRILIGRQAGRPSRSGWRRYTCIPSRPPAFSKKKALSTFYTILAEKTGKINITVMRIMVKMISIMYVIDHDYHDAHENVDSNYDDTNIVDDGCECAHK